MHKFIQIYWTTFIFSDINVAVLVYLSDQIF